MVMARYVLVAAAASAVSAKISVQVHRNLEVAPTTNVVVKFHCDQPLSTHRRRLQAGASRADTIQSLVESLQEHTSATQKDVLGLLATQPESTDGSSATVTATTWIDCAMYINNASDDVVKKIAAFPQVKSIHEPVVVAMSPMKPTDAKAEAAGANQWGIDMIQAPAVWAKGNKGQGIVVGSIDTGVRYTHEALQSNWRKEYGWFDPYNGTDAPYDKWGHGTHTMGTIAGTAQGMGVAPGSQWMSCLGCNYLCYQQQVIQCAQFMLCPTDSKGNKKDCSKAPHVVSNSYGMYSAGQNYLDEAIAAWREASIIPVFANCNEQQLGCGFAGYPASSPNVIGVGGTNERDSLYLGTSLGPTADNRIKPDVAAPGEDVASAANYDDKSLTTMSGTSMAAPHVAGAIALYLVEHKGATYDQVYTAFTNNADTKLVLSNRTCGGIPDTQYPNNIYGYGRINVLKAVTAAPDTPRPTLAPPPPVCARTELNTNFEGGDIKSTWPREIDDCCTDCQNTPNCNAYSWTYVSDPTPQGGTCLLKNLQGAPERKYNEFYKSATMYPQGYNCGPMEYNTDYAGFDIKSTSQAKPESCCAECQKTKECKVFVWTPDNGGTCYLKSAKGEMKWLFNAKAGSAPSKPNPPSDCGALEENTDYADNDLSSTSQAKAESCCADCQNTPKCKVFVWNNYNGGTCWLKTAKGKKTVMGAKAGSIGSSDNQACGAVESNVDYVDQDVAEAPGAASSDCCTACQANAACNAYSWFNGVCYLKSGR
ncbi:hypothetical protein As57867_017578, partial [Aphanomyces stellatus]